MYSTELVATLRSNTPYGAVARDDADMGLPLKFTACQRDPESARSLEETSTTHVPGSC